MSVIDVWDIGSFDQSLIDCLSAEKALIVGYMTADHQITLGTI
ncbi:hypothetical protein ACC817_08345 [Rhizobium ruizarguesonis]